MSGGRDPRIGNLSWTDSHLWRIGANPGGPIETLIGWIVVVLAVLACVLLTLESGPLVGLALLLVLSVVIVPPALVVENLLGTLLWPLGRAHQATTVTRVVVGFRGLAERRRSGYVRTADEEVEAYTLVGDRNTGRLFVDGEYVATHALVGEDEVQFVEDCRLDLRTRRVTFESVVRSFPHEEIETIAYGDPHLILRMNDGRTVTFRSGERPANLIVALDARRLTSRKEDRQGEYALET